MIDKVIKFVNWAVGADTEILTAGNMAVRAMVVYILAVVLIRLGAKRALAKPSAFDVVLVLMLGSVISRSITGNSPFYPTLLAALTLVFMHTIFAYITYYSSYLGVLVKGRPLILIRDGKIQWDKMKAAQLTERDVLSAIRRNAQLIDIKRVKLAVLERNGEISVIPYQKHLKIVDVKVHDEVQTVKVELQE